jgi:chorismate mutase
MGRDPNADSGASKQEIARQRQIIDRIDLELLELLNARARAALVIAREKLASGLPIYDPVREQSIFESVRRHNQGPFENEAVTSLFERIIDETRRLERRTRKRIEQPKAE